MTRLECMTPEDEAGRDGRRTLSGTLRHVVAALLCLLLLPAAAPAETGRRVALVIGNGNYMYTSALANPVTDAVSTAEALRRLGFETVTGLDMTLPEMRRAIRSFAELLPGAETALFFYAGHGVQVHGTNYLLPVDTTISSELDLDFAALELDLVLKQMDRFAPTKIVLLDACRNNPFEEQLTRAMGVSRSTRALGQGLAKIEASGGTLIGFATEPGAVAYDGDGLHSPFTDAILRHIETPGLEINVAMTRIRADVWERTNGRQRPWTTTSLMTETYLAGRLDATPEPAPAPAPTVEIAPTPTPMAQASRGLMEVELVLWQSAERSGRAEDYREYLRQFPGGVFSVMAENRLASIERPAPAAPAADAATVGTALAGAALPSVAEAAGNATPRPRDGGVAAPGGGGNAAAGRPQAGANAGAAAPDPSTFWSRLAASAGEAAAGAAAETATQALASDEAPAPAPASAAEATAAAGPAAPPTPPRTTAGGDAQDDLVIAALPDQRAGDGRQPEAEAARPPAPAATRPAPAAAPSPEDVEDALGLDRGERRLIQRRLTLIGHDTAGVDGIFGPRSRTAIRNWQRVEGLAQTGFLDARGLEMLRMRSAAALAAWQRAEEERRAARRQTPPRTQSPAPAAAAAAGGGSGAASRAQPDEPATGSRQPATDAATGRAAAADTAAEAATATPAAPAQAPAEVGGPAFAREHTPSAFEYIPPSQTNQPAIGRTAE